MHAPTHKLYFIVSQMAADNYLLHKFSLKKKIEDYQNLVKLHQFILIWTHSNTTVIVSLSYCTISLLFPSINVTIDLFDRITC